MKLFSRSKKKNILRLRIGIAGIGFVGKAMQGYFKTQGAQLFIYDKGGTLGSLEELNNADIIFLCLPTPFEEPKGYDDSAIWEVIKGITGKKIIVIKSTVLPGTTQAIQDRYPHHSVLFNPEFLRARTASQDFLNPERQIIGYTKKSKPDAKKVLELLPKARYQRIMRATEAEVVKYFGNAFLSLRVVFANQMYDLCSKLHIDYKQAMEAAGHDSRIGHSHFDVFHEGYRGYQGNCFPKDVKALIQFAREKGVPLELIEVMHSINAKLIAKKMT